ncbi:MAG: oligosaccharide flippase family protein [Clostridia bacterium]|nr:oligosaccharide flippase family protein [Clostridia bacterium]
MKKEAKGRGRRGATLLNGVLLLTLANLLVKVFGFLYKVPLNRWLGDEMANVNTAYSVYTLLYMISTAGIPVAVSVLISEARTEGRGERVRRIFRVSLVTLALVGGLGTLLLFLLAHPIANANSGGDSYLCLLAIAPALFFICLSSVFRGYFQGFGLLRPTAVSTVIEALGKMALGLFLVRLVLRLTEGGTPLAAGYSVLAITVGIALGALYLAVAYTRFSGKALTPLSEGRECDLGNGAILRRLLSVAVPIAIGSGVMSLSSLIDTQLMRPLLTSYYGDAARAKAVFSDYSTGAITLFNLPAVLIYPITSAIVPYITAARTEGREGDAAATVGAALRTAALLAFPSAFGLSALARPILSVLFLGDRDMAENAGGLLSVLAIAVVPLGLLAITNAVLQAYKKQARPMISMLLGVVVKVVAVLGLTPALGPLAAPVGTLLFYLSALLLNFYFIYRDTSLTPEPFSLLAPPALGALLAALGAAGTYALTLGLGEAPALALAVVVAVLVYLPSVLWLGGVSEAEVRLLPRGERLSQFLSKHHFIRKRELPMKEESKENLAYEELLQVVRRLRAEDGCPWDRAQTHETLSRYLIEETYEVLEALETGSAEDLCEELGDLLLQILFHAELERERGGFGMEAVARKESEKMILRHPHVFGDASAEETLSSWESSKSREKHRDTLTERVGSIPRALPALLRAEKVIEKCEGEPAAPAVPSALQEEIVRLSGVADAKDKAAAAGRFLLAAVAAFHSHGVVSEEALSHEIQGVFEDIKAKENAL